MNMSITALENIHAKIIKPLTKLPFIYNLAIYQLYLCIIQSGIRNSEKNERPRVAVVTNLMNYV